MKNSAKVDAMRVEGAERRRLEDARGDGIACGAFAAAKGKK